MRSSTLAVAAAVLVLSVLVASGGAAARRPVVMRQGQGGSSPGASAVLQDRVAMAVQSTSTNSSAQPSNCTYGHNSGGVCPPTPPAPGAGH
ncbi:hypothetical protein ZEAMMB73_Zm00001d034483 [Zea mays]|uniref:Uncharacterized protein n=1 Tax=Zea mays TaxID=4577 RepID=A0A1D6L7Y4_MAIZE|nr:hypothetical protein ZEAMMB73_Zm00001d034483 [Zea mays]